MTQGKATGHFEGIFYWEPEAPAGYNGGYDKGCFNNSAPTVALDAFK
jgi:arabinogalactan endo-1,4-beta-galactosidase